MRVSRVEPDGSRPPLDDRQSSKKPARSFDGSSSLAPFSLRHDAGETRMGITLLQAAVGFLMLSVSAAQANEIVGRPRIVDGDTIVIAGTSVRLHGIDAPEKKQAGGKQASAGLADLIAVGGEVRCQQIDTDRGGRAVAICRVGARDLSAAMVRGGLAWAYARYSPDYVRLEREARRNRVGIWDTDQVLGFRSVAVPQPPWEYRAERRRGLLRWLRATVGDWME